MYMAPRLHFSCMKMICKAKTKQSNQSPKTSNKNSFLNLLLKKGIREQYGGVVIPRTGECKIVSPLEGFWRQVTL